VWTLSAGGPDWMPITPKTGSLFHAETHIGIWEPQWTREPMTSFRQIEANRRNALRSTGPNTEDGKRRSRRNALRHGLSAETVVEIVEDIDDYRGFEAAVIADYDARTAVERELVLRLVSLLWRLRRATAIETELPTIQAEILRDRRHVRVQGRSQHLPCSIVAAKFLPLQNQDSEESRGNSDRTHAEPDPCH
jgi:hypothetical protein